MHHLKKQGLIVWIGIDPDDEYKISVQISNDKEPFEMQQRILIDKEHYTCAMEVTDRRSEDEISADEFLIAMFPYNFHDIPCQLVSFKKGADSKWMISSKTEVTHPERTKTLLLNCFITAENLIFVILHEAMVLLDSALTKVKDIKLTDIHMRI